MVGGFTRTKLKMNDKQNEDPKEGDVQSVRNSKRTGLF